MFKHSFTSFKQERAIVAKGKRLSELHHNEQMTAQGIPPAMLSRALEQTLCLVDGQADLVTSDHHLQKVIRNQKESVEKLTW